MGCRQINPFGTQAYSTKHYHHVYRGLAIYLHRKRTAVRVDAIQRACGVAEVFRLEGYSNTNAHTPFVQQPGLIDSCENSDLRLYVTVKMSVFVNWFVISSAEKVEG